MLRTIGDIVREHAKQNIGSTGAACELLELPVRPENNSAGNLYCAALSIIAQQDAELAALRKQLEEAKRVLIPFAKEYAKIVEKGLNDESMPLSWSVSEKHLRAASEWLSTLDK